MIRSRGEKIFSFFNYTFFVILGILMLYPFWYVLMFSLNDPNFASVRSINLYPEHFSMITYKYVLTQPFIYIGYKNTIIITLFGTLISMALTVGCAYPLSKDRLVGRRGIFALFFFTMLFSGGTIPTYLVVKQLHMVDTLWALMLPGAVSVYYMLIMIKFFKGIPAELIESAKMDGAGEFYTLFRIVLPLSGAVTASVGLMYAVGKWNEYLSGVIYINSFEKQVLQVALNGMLRGGTLSGQEGLIELDHSPESVKMAAIIVSVIPILMVYPFLQKYFVKGMMLGAVKG